MSGILFIHFRNKQVLYHFLVSLIYPSTLITATKHIICVPSGMLWWVDIGLATMVVVDMRMNCLSYHCAMSESLKANCKEALLYHPPSTTSLERFPMLDGILPLNLLLPNHLRYLNRDIKQSIRNENNKILK